MSNIIPDIQQQSRSYASYINENHNTMQQNTIIPESHIEEKAELAELTPLTNRGVFLPNFSHKNLGKTRTVTVFDWIEWTGKKTELFCQRSRKYALVDTSCQVIKKITLEGKEVATLRIELGAGIDKSWCSVKLANEYCYQAGEEIRRLIVDLNHDFGITFKNFTRLDVACDLQGTDYRNISCQRFMEKVAKMDYVFKGKATRMRDGSTMEYTAEVIKTYRARQVGGIRIGCRKSGISISMYNKSKEMREKVNKPWVSHEWDKAGFYADCDTYRIEMSYCKSAKSLVNKDTGQVYDHADINVIMDCESLYRALYSKHFIVAINQPGERFSRLERIELLSLERNRVCNERLTDKLKSNNYVKATIKSLLLYSMKEQMAGAEIHSSEVYRCIRNLCEEHCLNDWFKRKFPGLYIEEKIITYHDLLTRNEIKTQRLQQAQLF